MNRKLIFLIFSQLVMLINNACASQYILNTQSFKIEPENINSTGICIEIHDFGEPDVGAKIKVPNIYEGEYFKTFVVIFNAGDGESILIESSPILMNGGHSIFLSSIQDDGVLDGIEVQAVYGGVSTSVLVQSIELELFRGEKSEINCQ